MADHPILDIWLSGTTCSHPRIKRSVLFENDTHIVLKHSSHSEYMGRFSGVATCRAYAMLVEKTSFSNDRDVLYGFGGIKRWEGRINPKTVLADCAALGIVFKEK